MTSGLQQFEFEIVAIDRQGEIVERSIRRAQQVAEDLGNGVILEMVALPGGMFRMGSGKARATRTTSSAQRAGCCVSDGEIPGHARTMGSRHGLDATLPLPRRQTAGGPRPWHDSWEFCQRLAVKTGRAYRLPSEAEWEYACRADTTTPFYVGETLTTDLANYVGEHTYLGEPKGVYRHGTTDGGSFPPNAFGLYDMHGNVWEWCADAWHDDYGGAPTDGRAWESRGTVHRVCAGGVGMIHRAYVAALLGLSKRRTKGRTSLGSGWRWGHWKQALMSPSSRLECVQ